MLICDVCVVNTIVCCMRIFIINNSWVVWIGQISKICNNSIEKKIDDQKGNIIWALENDCVNFTFMKWCKINEKFLFIKWC